MGEKLIMLSFRILYGKKEADGTALAMRFGLVSLPVVSY